MNASRSKSISANIDEAATNYAKRSWLYHLLYNKSQTKS